MKFTGIAAAAIATTLVSGAASAATLSLVGSYSTAPSVAGNDLGYSGPLDYISGDIKDAASGLYLNGPAQITYTYLGKEAGNTNFASDPSGQFFTTSSLVGATHVVTQLVAGLLQFSFGTSAPVDAIGLIANDGLAVPASVNYAIAYKQLSATSYVVLFDDIAGGDRDFDDLGMRIDVVDVVPIPVPATGFLLLAALGGLGAFGRKRRATA